MPQPHVVAVIPARGGSRGVTRKNLAPVGGQSLVARAVMACRSATIIDVVAVSTDAAEIAAEARRAGAVIVTRPDDLAGDHATSESALLHALGDGGLGSPQPDVVVFAQATSPFIDPRSLRRAVERVLGGECDVVFSAVPTYEFLWVEDASGAATGLNHDSRCRVRRQDRQADWRETGAFYVMNGPGFVAAGHRFFGRICVEEVAASDAVEIDTADQLALARALAAARPSVLPGGTDFGQVVALVTDFDGVHTDDRVCVDEHGTETVVASRADGHGIALLRRAGVPVLIVSTETNAVVARRAAKLGVEVLHGLDDKWTALRRWLDGREIDPARVAYVGNDVNDLDSMAGVGVPIAVADAHPSVLGAAAYVTARRGGEGAVREVIDRIIAARSSIPSGRGGLRG